MIGSFQIDIQSRNNNYRLFIRRNITILQGNSATGKTSICNYIQLFNEKMPNVAITIKSTSSEVPAVEVLQTQAWEYTIKTSKNTIFFIDEDLKFLYTDKFAKSIQKTTNYFVIISRHSLSLSQLPISITEIYELKTSGKYTNAKECITYTYNTHLWKPLNSAIDLNNIESVVTEDSSAGFKFFSTLFDKCTCLSSNGASGIIETLRNLGNKNAVVIVDGAACGGYLANLINYLNLSNVSNLLFYFPESFEWLLLYSTCFDNFKMTRAILENPTNHIDSYIFVSWERYFEDLFKQNCLSLGMVYKKNMPLDYRFNADANKKRILSLLKIDCLNQ